MTRLSNKVAIVTGSSSGIGRAIALRYAGEGAKVVCADLAPHAREQTVSPVTHEAITQAGGEAIFQETDVTSAAQMEELVRIAGERFGRLDIMVNNAGMGMGKWSSCGLHLAEEEQWDLTMNVNAKSVFLGCKYALGQMLRQDPHPSGERGWIVNMSSIASMIAIEGSSAYCASKGAVSTLTRQAANDYASQRIHVNAICPGFTRTPILGGMGNDPAVEAELKKRQPLGGVGDPEDIARCAVALASDDARFMTGICLPVDGGYTVQ